MAKERVVIFEGEDMFIKPRNMVYDVNSGEANFIRDEPPSGIGVPPVDKIDDMPSDGGVRRTPLDLPPLFDPKLPVEPPIDKPVDRPVEKPIEPPIDKPVDRPVEKPVELPIDKPVDRPVDKPIDAKVPKDEPPTSVGRKDTFVPQEPKLPTIITTFPTIPLGTTGFGVAPSGGRGGAGGGENASKKKKSFNWLWILLAGGAALYFLTRKKN